MAREAPRSGAGSARVPTNVEWLESVGLRWNRMTPQQVMAYLVSKGRSVAEADEYVGGLAWHGGRLIDAVGR